MWITEAGIIDQLLSLSPKTVACTLHTFEAPAPFLRELTRQTLAIADDSAMLAAVELGLGTCWVDAVDEAAAGRALGLPSGQRAAVLLPLGYPAGEPEARPRLPANEIIMYDKWQ